MSSVRGRDEKDRVKDMRDRARYDIDAARNISVNKFRPKQKPKTNPSVFKAHNFSGANIRTGGDERDIVKNAVERSKRIKAHSYFLNTPIDTDTKINTPVGGPF
tara:strand:- start:936 stop:1247 length:312 start_codon:yes stop_codon:yes gene_type:complete